MRQQDKIIIWPAYFDSTKTRKNGRRTAKSLAVPLPKILEIKDAAERLHMDYELRLDAGYSKTPTHRTGMLLVKKKASKEEIIERIAGQLVKTRNTAQASAK